MFGLFTPPATVEYNRYQIHSIYVHLIQVHNIVSTYLIDTYPTIPSHNQSTFISLTISGTRELGWTHSAVAVLFCFVLGFFLVFIISEIKVAPTDHSLSETTSKAFENIELIAMMRPLLVVPWPECALPKTEDCFQSKQQLSGMVRLMWCSPYDYFVIDGDYMYINTFEWDLCVSPVKYLVVIVTIVRWDL